MVEQTAGGCCPDGTPVPDDSLVGLWASRGIAAERRVAPYWAVTPEVVRADCGSNAAVLFEPVQIAGHYPCTPDDFLSIARDYPAANYAASPVRR